MNRMTSDPWREIDQIQREMNRLFDRSGRRDRSFYPSVNIWADENSARITAELPGYSESDVEITILGELLRMNGSRKAPECGQDDCFHRQERIFGDFTREIKLPFLVDAQKVTAVFRNGVLQITLPRAEADKPKKITIKSQSA